MPAVLEIILALLVLTAVLLGGCGAGTTSDSSPSPSPIPMLWTVKTLDPATPSLFGVDFADAQHGWAAGADGTILASSDGGTTWCAQRSGTGQRLVDVDFADRLTGWAVGDSGVIVATQDGGATWTSQSSGTRQGLQAVSFVDARRGWAVGSRGTLLSTANGGRTWRSRRVAREALMAVVFVDAHHGWLISHDGAERGSVLATSDGGAHWRKQFESVELFDIAFRDRLHGQLAGAWGTWWTDDGGATWNAAGAPGPSVYVAVAPMDARRGWLAAEDTNAQAIHIGVVLSTRDGGRTWTKVWQGSSYESLEDLVVLPDDSVVAVGSDLDEHAVVLMGTPKSAQ